LLNFRKIILFLFFLSIAAPCFPQVTTSPPFCFEEEDGSPAQCFPVPIKVSNGKMTTNADGSISLDLTGGVGGTGDLVTVNGTDIDTTANFLTNTEITFVSTDGGAGGPDDVTATINDVVTVTDWTLTSPIVVSVDVTGSTLGGNIYFDELTVSEILALDASGYVQTLAVATYPSLTELARLKGITDSITTLLDAKQGTLTNSAGLASALSDESGSGLVLFGTSPVVTDMSVTGSTMGGNIHLDDLTVSEILALDGSGYIQTLAVVTYPSLVELARVKGVTSAIQTQFSGKQSTLTNSQGLYEALSDESGTGLALFGTSPVVTSISVTGSTLGGIVDGGEATSWEMPNAAAPTTDVTGKFGFDTDIITQGLMSVFGSTAQNYVVATVDTPEDNEIPKYDSASGSIYWEDDTGGSGSGDLLANGTVPMTADFNLDGNSLTNVDTLKAATGSSLRIITDAEEFMVIVDEVETFTSGAMASTLRASSGVHVNPEGATASIVAFGTGATANPCVTYGEGSLFYNTTDNVMCFCPDAVSSKRISFASSSCF